MKFPKEIYVGYQVDRYRNTDNQRTLGFATGKDNTKASANRMRTVDGWRDKKIEPKTFANDPLRGFRVAAFTTRYSTSNKLIRVADPRGFELEIPVSNLIDIIHENTLVNGEIIGEFLWGNDSASELVSINDQRYLDACSPAKARLANTVGEFYTDQGRTRIYKYLGTYHYAQVACDVPEERDAHVSPNARRRSYYGWSSQAPYYYYDVADVKMDYRYIVKKNKGKKIHAYLETPYQELGEYDPKKSKLVVRTTPYKDLLIVDRDEMTITEFEKQEFKLTERSGVDSQNGLDGIPYLFESREELDAFEYEPVPADFKYRTRYEANSTTVIYR